MVSGRHADQSAAWKRYKNRKQTIRRRWQAGAITDAERVALLADAFAAHASATMCPAEAERYAVGRAWLAAHPDAVPCGDDSCPAALRTRQCHCACEGRNHGAAVGAPPLVPLHRRTVTCAICRTGFRPANANARYCWRCRPEARRRRERRRRTGSPHRRRVHCASCGLRFRPTSTHRRYCGDDCRDEGYRRRARERERRRAQVATATGVR